ncbi:MAG TPA: CDP-alcohol phosphatidyltransferase family protein [Dongiaceae bacterium]|nr:CDP-alcohol phosphatidyltransferase family protein [Dongiaceae bacterium]
MIVWIDATGTAGSPAVFGLGLVERHLHALRMLKPAPTRVVIDLAPGQAKPALPDRRLHRLPIEWREDARPFAERCAAAIAAAGGQPVLLLDGATLADPRLHRTLAERKIPTAVESRDAGERAGLLLLTGAAPSALPDRCTDVSALAHSLVETGQVQPLPDDAFTGFVRRLRRTLPYYVFRVDDAARAAKIERFLFWSNYKGSTDVFTRYVYPPLVWLMVRPLARLRIHPNWVTLVSILFALAAVPLWASGHFISGFVLAYAMSVLDSVDGKLARLTFTDSELGNYLDHGLDMVHPPLWYVAWAYGLGIAAEGWDSTLGHAAIAIVACYALDRVVLKIYPKVFGRAFHTHSRMDGIVRSFIARRNISLPIFTVGWLAGLGREAFYLIVAWQAATLAYHAGRTFWILAIERAQHKGPRGPSEVGVKTVGVD